MAAAARQRRQRPTGWSLCHHRQGTRRPPHHPEQGRPATQGARSSRHERAPSAALRDTIRPMSYDFGVLTPESVGIGGQEALAAAVVAFEQDHFADAEQDRRLRDFVTDLEEAGAADEENG